MSDECRNDCLDPLPFPRRPHNRPGLSRIGYRIGAYDDFRTAMLRSLDADPLLADWTHRAADDPGIALLEGAAILGDILTLYQELYANEAFLRTARWRPSVAGLVRLAGYHLSPGLGGRATFAFDLRGKAPVLVPADFPLSARLAGQETAADFQTSQSLTALPHLSDFRLYRPRTVPQPIKKGLKQLELESVVVTQGEEERQARDVGTFQALRLQAGDRLLLFPSGEILQLTAVEQVLDRVILTLAGSLTRDHGDTVEAFRIGRSFRHFGHNAPALTSTLREHPAPRLDQDKTNFLRRFDTTHSRYCTLQANELPLDSGAGELPAGSSLVCQIFFHITVTAAEPGLGERAVTIDSPDICLRHIANLRADALSWGNLTAAVTVLTLDDNLSRSPDSGDIRKCLFHEVIGPRLTLRAPSAWEDGPLTERTLHYWGRYDEVRPLAGRMLMLHKSAAETCRVQVTTTQASIDEALAARDTIHPWRWPIALDNVPPGLSLADFDEQQSRVAVFGNLVEATQGKAQREAVLGDGDARAVFQSFKLPQAPLTYLLDPGATPPEVPELRVFVNDLLWQWVPSFFGRGPQETIYIVREDDTGDSWVQFGDGTTGRRLPSGLRNVVARYRTGIAARGTLQEGSTVQAGAPLKGLHAVRLPATVHGGAEAEGPDNAKKAAPGKVQGLGRLVSLADYESELLALAGVRKARAGWTLHQHVPALGITVLTRDNATGEEAALRELLVKAHRERGAQRFPIVVIFAVRQYIFLHLQVGHDPRYRAEQLEATIRQTLGVAVAGAEDDGRGLFSEERRRFGQAEYASRIEGSVQNIAGVVWVRVSRLGFVTGNGTDPLTLQEPEDAVSLREILCDPARDEAADQVLLCLHARHFHPVLTAVDPVEVLRHA
ncbi:MAG: hypothetical protein BWK76_10860 [Desulfobulbaceae bacterium A2]|nr:MAG: hypothetical protein BWK76_10860 [Desulfobulbaceae bacterium A2]